MVLGKRLNLYTTWYVGGWRYFLPLVRLSLGVKYDVAGISFRSLLNLYIMISRDLSRRFYKIPFNSSFYWCYTVCCFLIIIAFNKPCCSTLDTLQHLYFGLLIRVPNCHCILRCGPAHCTVSSRFDVSSTATDSRVYPWRMYLFLMNCCFLDIWMIVYFWEWNCICHSRSHF